MKNTIKSILITGTILLGLGFFPVKTQGQELPQPGLPSVGLNLPVNGDKVERDTGADEPAPISGETENLDDDNESKQNEELNGEEAGTKSTAVRIINPQKEMKRGEKQALLIESESEDGKEVEFYSSNENVASIDSKGEISANEAGEAEIIALIGDVKDSFVLKVIDDAIYATEIEFGEYQDIMKPKQRQTMMVMIFPESTTDKTVKFTSSDSSVAKINQLGMITALKEGETIIRAVCGKAATEFKLSVTKEGAGYKPVEKIELAETLDKLEVDQTAQLYASVIPVDATKQILTYTSQTPDIVSVTSKGTVKGLKPGNAVITISADNCKIDVTFSVYVKTKEIKVNNSYMVLKPDQDEKIQVSVSPAESCQDLTFESKDTRVATVSEDGTVRAAGVGSTAIIISNGDLTVSVSVIVNSNDQIISEIARKDSVTPQRNYKHSNVIDSSVHKIISSDELLSLYKEKDNLLVLGNGYSFTIAGEDIRNYKNTMATDIELENDEEGIKFCLNKGKFMCGKITLCIDDITGNYLYLYNTVKEVYEEIDFDDISTLSLTSPGTYLISDKKIKYVTKWIKIMAITGSAVCCVCAALYIGIKKRYWFW